MPTAVVQVEDDTSCVAGEQDIATGDSSTNDVAIMATEAPSPPPPPLDRPAPPGRLRARQSIRELSHRAVFQGSRTFVNAVETTVARNGMSTFALRAVNSGSASSTAWFTPDGRTLALGRVGQKCVSFHCLATGKETTAVACSGRVTASTVSLDGSLMCVATDTGHLAVHQLSQRDRDTVSECNQIALWTQQLGSRISDVRFSPDASTLAVVPAGSGGAIILDAETGDRRIELSDAISTKSAITGENVLSECAVAFSCEVLAVRGGGIDSKRVRLWNVGYDRSTNKVARFTDPRTLCRDHDVVSVAVSADSRYLAVALRDSGILDIELLSPHDTAIVDGGEVCSHQIGDEDRATCRQLIFTPSCTQLAAARVSGTYEIYDVVSNLTSH